jgi:hypothetical protein
VNTATRPDKSFPRSVVDDLWATEGRTIGEIVPDIVQSIKLLRPDLAEELLLLVLHSPKAKRLPMLLKPMRGLRAQARVTDLILDAAGLPRGSVRPHLRAAYSAAVKSGHGIAVGAFIEAVKSLLGAPKENTKRKRAQRANAKLGYQRKRGRPSKMGQK